MRRTILTPQEKAVAVNSMIGNPGIANQQGTTRVMYDTLPLDGRLEFRFFEQVANRQFPFTNLNQNKLQVGETFALTRIYFAIVTDTEGVYTVDTIDAAAPELNTSEFSIYFDTMQVVKPLPLTSLMAEFSHNSQHPASNWFEFDNRLILPTDVQFRCEMDATDYAGPVANTYIRCVWEGFGTILSPKTQF
jgi:hypothetical protein